MLTKTLLILGLAASSTFAWPSAAQEDPQQDTLSITSGEDRELRLGSVQSKLELRRSLRQELARLQKSTASLEALIKAKEASLAAEVHERITSLERSVAEAPRKIQVAQKSLDDAEKELELAESNSLLGAHSKVIAAKKNRREAERKLILYTSLQEGNSKALSNWNARTPQERIRAAQPEREKLSADRAVEASLV